MDLQHTIHKREKAHSGSSHHFIAKLASAWQYFITWCKKQESNRMAWLAVSLFFHACILFPAIVIINAMAGNSLTLLIISISSLMLMFVTNLSQMPEKIIIPAIFLSVLIDLLIIIICLIHGIDPSLLYKR